MLELPHGNPEFAATHKMLVDEAGPDLFRLTFVVNDIPRIVIAVLDEDLLGYAQLYKEEFFVRSLFSRNGFWFQLGVLDALELQEYVSERMLL